MQLRTFALALTLAFTLVGCERGGTPAKVAQTDAIAWRQGDVDDAFAEAKELGKPVLLYWGAEWCPPCAQMKATLFKDSAFIAETRNFVPVYLDGDTRGAQQWSERFGISGYPTVVVLRPDRTEVTRISNTTMAAELPRLLQVAAKRTTSIEALLHKAAADTASLSADDWRILAGFDWRNDPKHFSDLAKAGTLLDRLAEAAPDPALKRRFELLSLVETVQPDGQGRVVLTSAHEARLGEILRPILANRYEIMANRWELISDVPNFVAGLPAGPEREALSRSLSAAADAIFANESLALTERLNALNVDLTFALASGKPPPPTLVRKIRERVAWADDTAKDKISRQSVIGSAAGLLSYVDPAAAKKLLLAELNRSDQPYYYMSLLATAAEFEGDKAGAIEWYRKAYESSEGPATRVDWAVKYASAVLRLAPDDKAAVARSAEAVIAELGKSPDNYYQNTRKKVAGLGDKLREWSKAHSGGSLLSRLQTQMAGVCARQGEQAAACSNWAKA
ncbi:MAG: thioredoxin family protein [Sphingomicrobium sp.]